MRDLLAGIDLIRALTDVSYRRTLDVVVPPPPSEDSADERATKRQRRVSFCLLPPKMEMIEGTPERKSVGKGKARATPDV